VLRGSDDQQGVLQATEHCSALRLTPALLAGSPTVAALSKASSASARLPGLRVRIPTKEHGYLSVVIVGCVVRWRSMRRADHSSRGVLPTVVCVSMIIGA